MMAFQLAAPHDETQLGLLGQGGSGSLGGVGAPQPYASGRESGSNLTGANSVGSPNRPLAAAMPAGAAP